MGLVIPEVDNAESQNYWELAVLRVGVILSGLCLEPTTGNLFDLEWVFQI